MDHIRSEEIEGKTTVIHEGRDDIKKLRMQRAYQEAIKEIKDQGKGVKEEVKDIIREKNNG